jgi:hypothetical protein
MALVPIHIPMGLFWGGCHGDDKNERAAVSPGMVDLYYNCVKFNDIKFNQVVHGNITFDDVSLLLSATQKSTPA